MNTIATKTSLFALAVAALLSTGLSVANAQNFTRPDTDIRSLEAPVDVTVDQLRAQQSKSYYGQSYQGRSAGVAGDQVQDQDH